VKFQDFYQRRLIEDAPQQMPNQPGEVSGGWRTGQTGGGGGEEGWAATLHSVAQSLPDFGLRQFVGGLDQFEPEQMVAKWRQEAEERQQAQPQQGPPAWLGVSQQMPGEN